MTNEEITSQAIEFAKKNKLRIARELTSMDYYKPAVNPVSVFMAGSPGAGKTEFSKNLLERLKRRGISDVIRIDGDEIRQLVPGYTGINSYLFQGAISLVVEKLHDLVLLQSQNFILDGTFANYQKAGQNIQRSLDRGRQVFVFYVYQKPATAWRFTQAREKKEGRNILKSVFIDQFFGAKDSVDSIIKDFGERVKIRIVIKNIDDNTDNKIVRLKGNNSKIDDYVDNGYTKGGLMKVL